MQNLVNLDTNKQVAQECGVGNVNPMKMARCIIELERIYGIRQGSAGGNGSNQYIKKEDDPNNLGEAKSQEQLAKQIGIPNYENRLV